MKDLFDKVKKEEEKNQPDLSSQREDFRGKIRRRNLIIDLISMGLPGLIILFIAFCFLFNIVILLLEALK